MVIKINGKDESIDNISTIAELISKKAFSPARIVIEHNYRIVPKEKWDSAVLSDNDNIEIIGFMVGG